METNKSFTKKMSILSSIAHLLESRLYFQYQSKQRVAIYIIISTFIGIVAFTIASFHPTPLYAKLLVGISYFLCFGCAAVVVSEIRISILIWKGKNDFNVGYGELWIIGFTILLIGFYFLGAIQLLIWKLHIKELHFYFDPANGFMPFSLAFLLKMVSPTMINIVLVGHVILKKVPSQQETEKVIAEDPVTITSGNHSVVLNPKNISHISIVQHYATFYLNTIDGFDEVELKSSLVNIIKQLPQNCFFQVHRSHLVNINQIEKITTSGGEARVLIRSRQEYIPVSRRQLNELKTLFEKALEQKRSITVPEDADIR